MLWSAFPQQVHAVCKGAHTGQHQRTGRGHLLRGGGVFHYRTAVFQGALHAQKIAAPIIHNGYCWMHGLTSTPFSASSFFSWGMVACL